MTTSATDLELLERWRGGDVESGEQLRDGLGLVGEPQIGAQIGHRLEHEAALVQSRMRNGERFIIDDEVAGVQDVEVESAR